MPKPKNEETLSGRIEAPLQFKSNPDIQKRIDEYKTANQNDVAYYGRVVKEAPERAVDMLIYKDMVKHEADMKLVMKQMPQAKAFYEAQNAENKARIDKRLEGVNPYYHDKAFVNEVVREMTRQNRVSLSSPTPPKLAPEASAAGMSAG